MERTKSARSDRALSHRLGSLEAADLEAYTVLTEAGPVLQLGAVEFDEQVWSCIPRTFLWFAVDLHQCGFWGRISDVDIANNERALREGGSVVSRWMFVGATGFWVATDTSQSKSRTTVFVAHDED